MKIVWLILLILGHTVCHGQSQKINGVSFVASPDPINQSHILPLKNNYANWAAVMPFGFIPSLDNPNLLFDTDRQWWGERSDGTQETISLLQQDGIQVMLKPQLWVWKGEFTGDIQMNNEKDWLALEARYRKFILTYAKIASQHQTPILCIGTELSNFVLKRPLFWEQLIKDIRSVYNGKLTYAANWDTYNKMPFWCELDFIGIDAYFPISENNNPDQETISLGWQPHKKAIKAVQAANDIPVLFTEYGYRSVDYAGKAPWETNQQSGNINHKIQGDLLQGLFDTFWSENWFAGGFLWKWFHNHEQVGGLENNRFTIQNKPAATVVKEHYKTKSLLD